MIWFKFLKKKLRANEIKRRELLHTMEQNR